MCVVVVHVVGIVRLCLVYGICPRVVATTVALFVVDIFPLSVLYAVIALQIQVQGLVCQGVVRIFYSFV